MRAFHFYLTLLLSTFAIARAEDPRPKALVYRGPAACQGCPEAVASLLRSSTPGFDVEYAGPREKADVDAESLRNFDLYAQPGGGDLAPAWEHAQAYKKAIRGFVANGGLYAGFCLGAYLAGSSPGFELLPAGSDTDSESAQPKAQVKSTRDTIIQVDWTVQTGSEKGEQQKGRWMYFQDGAVIKLSPNASQTILGRYSSNGDVAAAVTSFGSGWVGLVGPHPEADRSWYQEYNMTNPEGIRFDLGHDFVQTLLQKGTSPPPAVPDRVLLALLVSLALWSLVFGDSAEL